MTKNIDLFVERLFLTVPPPKAAVFIVSFSSFTQNSAPLTDSLAIGPPSGGSSCFVKSNSLQAVGNCEPGCNRSFDPDSLFSLFLCFDIAHCR